MAIPWDGNTNPAAMAMGIPRDGNTNLAAMAMESLGLRESKLLHLKNPRFIIECDFNNYRVCV